jgi:hypothetical protein
MTAKSSGGNDRSASRAEELPGRGIVESTSYPKTAGKDDRDLVVVQAAPVHP